jgi:hypothetical protein
MRKASRLNKISKFTLFGPVFAADRNWMVREWIVKYDISYNFLPVLWIRTAFNADPDPAFPQC